MSITCRSMWSISQARIAGWADDDLIDDIVILQQYIDVLGQNAGLRAGGI